MLHNAHNIWWSHFDYYYFAWAINRLYLTEEEKKKLTNEAMECSCPRCKSIIVDKTVHHKPNCICNLILIPQTVHLLHECVPMFVLVCMCMCVCDGIWLWNFFINIFRLNKKKMNTETSSILYTCFGASKTDTKGRITSKVSG